MSESKPPSSSATSSSSSSSIAIPIFTAVLAALLSFFAAYMQFGRSIGTLEGGMSAIEKRLTNVESPEAIRDLIARGDKAIVAADNAAKGASTAIEDLKKRDSLHPPVPIGSVVAFPTAKGRLPVGWLDCDGQHLNRVEYQDLFDLIGTTYGGTGNEFFLPDYRGYFLRGFDDSGAVDPDRKDAGVGTKQADEFKSHVHHLLNDANQAFSYGSREGDNGENVRLMTGIDHHPANIQYEAVGGAETRPKNISVVWIIRAK